MKVSSYSFGRMEIDGETVTNDLMIAGSEIKRGWRRKEGHSLRPEDLEWLMDKDPSILIIGTGNSGLMSVLKETESYLKEKGIEFKALRTKDAVREFNEKTEEENPERVAGAFHLTC